MIFSFFKVKDICPTGPNMIYVSDFTHLRHNKRYLYLVTNMDLYTIEIVGWHISTIYTKDLVLQAFWAAIRTTGCIPKLAHSDQGSEYTSVDYTQQLETFGIQISMSKKSSPWENAYQESFYNNFKTDLGLEFDRFESIGELVEAIHHTIIYYNQERIHTTLKMSPVQFKQRVLDKVVSKKSTRQ